MTSREKIESYLLKLSLSFEKAGPDSWVIKDSDKGMDNLLVMLAEPLVIMRINVMAVPKASREKLFELLLKLNATDMSHGAYALDGNNLIIIDTLEMDTMDLQEFEASIDAIGVALAQHLRLLSAYHAKA